MCIGDGRERDGHLGGSHHEAHAHSDQLLPGEFGRGGPDGADGRGVAERRGQRVRLVGVRPRRLPWHHLLPVLGHQCVIMLHHRIHRGEVHRHLPPDQGAVAVHVRARQKDHPGRVAFHVALLRHVVLPERYARAQVQRRDRRDLRLQSVPGTLLTHILFRLRCVFRGTSRARNRPVRPHRENSVSERVAETEGEERTVWFRYQTLSSVLEHHGGLAQTGESHTRVRHGLCNDPYDQITNFSRHYLSNT